MEHIYGLVWCWHSWGQTRTCLWCCHIFHHSKPAKICEAKIGPDSGAIIFPVILNLRTFVRPASDAVIFSSFKSANIWKAKTGPTSDAVIFSVRGLTIGLGVQLGPLQFQSGVGHPQWGGHQHIHHTCNTITSTTTAPWHKNGRHCITAGINMHAEQC